MFFVFVFKFLCVKHTVPGTVLRTLYVFSHLILTTFGGRRKSRLRYHEELI